MRDGAFATAIVKFIANYANDQQFFEGNGGYAYNNSPNLASDAEIGYPAVQAFKTKGVRYILEEVKLDLKNKLQCRKTGIENGQYVVQK